jgi:glyoxylase-like metal-dependent hydrolase (beta-lactamase superfamily II)
MARLFPHSGYDFGDRLWTLPADGTVPGLENWRWLHTHGHVSLFRETDGTLLAGDALTTMDMDS